MIGTVVTVRVSRRIKTKIAKALAEDALDLIASSFDYADYYDERATKCIIGMLDSRNS